jgi:uncharacterized protein
MALLPEFFWGVTGFEWDEGNSVKLWRRHSVTQSEAEQVFMNRPIIVGDLSRPSNERRYFGLGRTDRDRQMMVVFTLRGSRIRVISARPMSRKERRIYAQNQA